MEDKKWTIQDVEQHLYLNKDDTYTMAIPLAALYKKLYGQLPSIGLSGGQTDYANQLLAVLPDGVTNETK